MQEKVGDFKPSSILIKKPCLKVLAAITAHQITEEHEEKKQILRFFVSQDIREVFMELHLPVFSSIRTPVITILWC